MAVNGAGTVEASRARRPSNLGPEQLPGFMDEHDCGHVCEVEMDVCCLCASFDALAMCNHCHNVYTDLKSGYDG